MEGDAGASRLNPTDADDSLDTQVTTEDSSEVDTDSADAEATTATDAETAETETETETADPQAEAVAAEPGAPVQRGPSRVGGKWLAGVAAVLVLLAGGIGAGGYFALRYHKQSQEIARNDAAAVKAAMDCVAATQAPDTSTMIASEQKIIDCGTDAFRTQAMIYTNMIVQAYQASNVHVEVSDIRGAVERNNPDGSIDVLVAMRVKVSGDQNQSEAGYRLRVTMSSAEGAYRISKLDQVTK
jgi:Mce-associated membrane protein